MAKHQFLSFIFSFILILIFATSSFADEKIYIDDHTKGVTNEKYKKQSSFICNKKEFKIPPYFPFGDKFSYKDNKQLYEDKTTTFEFYLTARESDCKIDYFNVVLGLNSNCDGAHICIDSSFAYSKVGANILENIQYVFSKYSKEIELDKSKIGYFIPSKCQTYCSTAKFIWFDYDEQKIFILSTKNPQNNEKVINELIKSANSYINAQM